MRLGGLLSVLLAAIALLASTASGSPSPLAAIPALPSRGQVVAERGHFLQLAEEAIREAKTHWWNEKLGWYNEQLDFNYPPAPLLMLWSAYQLFEAVDAVAVADPTPANIGQARWFADMAERYYNPTLKPVGAYAYYMGRRKPDIPYFFDDNGWFGLAFMDAYQATHDRRYVVDAERAFRFLAVSGWDPDGGGFWWNTVHPYTTSEPLAAGVWIGARLYEATKLRTFLSKAEQWDAWANRHLWSRPQGLYQRSPTDRTVMSYVEGLMAAGNEELCKITGKPGYCARAERVATNSLRAFSANLHWAPQYDAVDLRGILGLYSVDHSTAWYALAFHNAERAARNAADARGLFQLGWNGQEINLGKEVHPGQLGMQGASASLLAWVAAMRPPQS
jgi:uncharacterized protein YyaL (SSP411 family)